MPAPQAVRASSVRRAARFAYAAGITAMLANLFLIAFYALQASHPEDGTSLGSANDLIGSLATAFMIPVALALIAWLPDRRSARITHVIGLSAMAVLTVDGPLLVLGVLTFGVQAPIMVAAWMILCLWLFLVNRWLRLSDALSPRVARFGEFVGVGTLAGRWRCRRARVVAALDVVGAVDSLRRRRTSRGSWLARHPGLVPASGSRPCERWNEEVTACMRW